MGLLDGLTRQFNRLLSRGGNKFNNAFFWQVGNGEATYDYKMDNYLTEGYQYNPIIYSVINEMATKTTSIPYSIKKVEDKRSLKQLKSLVKATNYKMTPLQKMRYFGLETKAFQEGYLDMPLQKPNPNQTWTEFFSLFKTFLRMTGNFYIYVLKPTEGIKNEPLALYVLPSHLIKIVIKGKLDLSDNAAMIESPIDKYMLIEGESYVEFEAENVIHIKYSNPDYDNSGSHLYGQSPLRASYRNIVSSNNATTLGDKNLRNGGAFGFIHGKTTALMPEQADQIKERLKEMDADPDNLSRIAGLSAEVGFTRISLSPDEIKLFEFHKHDKAMIYDCLGWAMDDENRGDYGGTINELRKQRITDNIIPDLNLLCDAFNTILLPQFKGYENTKLEFDVMELPEMQEDTGELVEWVTKLLDRGVVNRNEARGIVNMEKSDNDSMDEYTVQIDVLTLDEALDTGFGNEA